LKVYFKPNIDNNIFKLVSYDASFIAENVTSDVHWLAQVVFIGALEYIINTSIESEEISEMGSLGFMFEIPFTAPINSLLEENELYDSNTDLLESTLFVDNNLKTFYRDISSP